MGPRIVLTSGKDVAGRTEKLTARPYAARVTTLRVLRGGTRAPLVLLLHGLGATADVWGGVGAALGDRAWAAPDLPGHVEIAVRGVPAPRNPADGNLGE